MQRLNEMKHEIHAALLAYVQYYGGEDRLSEVRLNELRTIMNTITHINDVVVMRQQLIQFVTTVSRRWRRVAPYTSANRLRNAVEAVVFQQKFTEVALYRALYLESSQLNQEHHRLINGALEAKVMAVEKKYQSVMTELSQVTEELRRVGDENSFFMQQLQVFYQTNMQLGVQLKQSQAEVMRLNQLVVQKENRIGQLQLACSELEHKETHHEPTADNDAPIVVEEEIMQDIVHDNEFELFSSGEDFFDDSVEVEMAMVATPVIQPPGIIAM